MIQKQCINLRKEWPQKSAKGATVRTPANPVASPRHHHGPSCAFCAFSRPSSWGPAHFRRTSRLSEPVRFIRQSPSPFRFDGEMQRLVLRQQFLDEGDPVGDEPRDSLRLLFWDPV